MNDKWFIFSKTHVLAYALLLLSLAQAMYGDPLIAKYPGFTAAVGVAVLVLRWFTTTGITLLPALLVALLLYSPAQAQQPLPGRVTIHPRYEIPRGSTVIIHYGFFGRPRRTDVLLPPQSLPGWVGQRQ